MLHIGIDMHKSVSQVEVMDGEGSVIDQSRLSYQSPEQMKEYFRGYGGAGVATLEATRNWYWMYELLEECGLEVKLAHPLKVKLIAESRIKTDKIDAHVLAQLERTGFLPESYIPSREVRDQREQLRYRLYLVKVRTSIKNRVHALLDKLGITHPFSDLFGKSGRRFLESLELREVYRRELDSYLSMLMELDGELKSVENTIRKSLKEDSRAQLLMTIPGVSHLTAYLLLSEIGEISRFKSEKHLCSYAGLVPSLHQSGSRRYQGHLTGQGNKYIQWVMIEAVTHAVRQDWHLARFYQRLKREKGSGQARAACARKLLVAVYFILKRGEPYKIPKSGNSNPGKPVKPLGQ